MTETDLPPEAAGRLERPAFSSGLTVDGFAACLHMGMRPVGLVQGFCVMNWSWYGAGSPYAGSAFWSGFGQRGPLSSYRCPHFIGYGNNLDHRSWGSNVDQPWMTSSWVGGYNSAFKRMLEEAGEAGAHGVVGVVDTSSHLTDGGVREFHMYGTAVVIEGADPPKEIWSTYLSGQPLAKLIEAGMFPVSVVASMVSVRVWAACTTEVLLAGRYDNYGVVRTDDEIVQMADAEMQARRGARDQIKRMLGHDTLYGAVLEPGGREISEGDLERHCTIRGTRVRRFKPAERLAAPTPTVTLR